jgi:hypothetical protein
MNGSANITGVLKPTRVRWEGHIERVEQMRNEYKIVVGKTGGKRPVGKPRRRWEVYIRMYLRELV